MLQKNSILPISKLNTYNVCHKRLRAHLISQAEKFLNFFFAKPENWCKLHKILTLFCEYANKRIYLAARNLFFAAAI